MGISRHGTASWRPWGRQLDMVMLLPIWTHSPPPPRLFSVSRLWEWSHVVNPLDIKQLHLEVIREWHCIPSIDVSMFLASGTLSDKLLCILIHRWPEESALPDLSIYTE